ncbi:MAG: hypothetical protein JSS94_01075 [Bacteroidetes bacterium]|nr:hypothetical protein [Bacteroidota bacterium]
MEWKSTSMILWTLTFIFIILSIKSSNEPVISLFEETVIEKYLLQFSNANNFIWDISIGFLLSEIFYIIVVYFPEKQKKKDISPFINSKCESIIFSSYSLIQEIIRLSNLTYNYKNLTSEQLNEACKIVNPKEHIFKFASNIADITEGHFGFKIYNSWARIINEIDETTRYPYIDSGLLKRLYKLFNNFLRYTAKDLAVIDRLNNDSLESWSSTFYDFYLETKDLRDYYILYSGKEFKNDPWK